MTTPHDDELRSALLDAPDHRPDFWAALDTDLAAEEREDMVPLAPATSTRPRGSGLLVAAAVLVVLGGIGAWFALSGDHDGKDVAVDPEPSVTTAPEDVPAAVQFEFRWIEPDGDPDPGWSTWTRDERGRELIVHPSGALRYDVPGEGLGYSPPGVEDDPLSGPRDDYDRIDDDARWVGHLWLDGADAVTETKRVGRDLLTAEVESYRDGDLRVELVVDAATWMPVDAVYSDGVRFETRGFDDTVSPEAIALPDPSAVSPDDPWLTWPEPPPVPEDGREPSFRLTWMPPGFAESGSGTALEAPWRTVEIDDGRGREEIAGAPRETYDPAGVLDGGMFDGETVLRSMPLTFGPRASVLTVDGRVTVSGDVPFGDMVRILEGMEAADPTRVTPVPANAVQSVTAAVERVSEVGPAGVFTLVADEDGTIIVRGDDLELGWHAPSGATWRIEGETSENEIDPINGRRGVESLLMLDLAESVRFGGVGTAADRDGRSYQATVDLADNESAGWFGRTATVIVDFQTGFVLDATITDDTGEVVEELHLTDIVWSDEPADVSGAVGVESEWTMTEGLPGEPVVGDRYLVPDGMDAVRTFTTDAAVASGSEAGNPPSAGAYVVDVTTAPWRHSKVIVLGRTAGESQDPLAEEGWFSDPEAVAPGSGELAGIEGSLVATPPIRPRAWFDLAPTEVVAIEGLVDPATAEQLWNLVPADAGPEPFVPTDLPAITTAPSGAESAFSIEGADGGGVVVARWADDGAAGATAWYRAVDEIWWEPDRGDPATVDTGGAHAVVLLDAFVDDDGEIAAVYGEVPSPDDVEPGEANLWLQRVGQSRSEAVNLGWFTGPEYGVNAASRGEDRIAIAAAADLGEVFSFVDLQGNEIDEPNNPVPVGHRYAEPPYYQHVALAPDGRTLAFIEGPENPIGDWELVVVDLETGDNLARITLYKQGTETVTHLDFDGTWAVISRDDPVVDRSEPVAALAVNTATGTVSSLPGTAGIVTLGR